MRDSLFDLGISNLIGQIKAKRSALEAQRAQANQDYQASLPLLAENRARSLQNANEVANKEGLFYSGILGQRRGDINTQYDRQGSAALQNNQRYNNSVDSQESALGDVVADPNSPYGYSATGGAGDQLYNLLSAAADRRVNSLSSDPVDDGSGDSGGGSDSSGSQTVGGGPSSPQVVAPSTVVGSTGSSAPTVKRAVVPTSVVTIRGQKRTAVPAAKRSGPVVIGRNI